MFAAFDCKKLEQISSLELAYVGDAVYELAVRRHLLAMGIVGSNRLHREAVKYVCADTQAKVLHALEPSLSEKELAVAKRGRNAKSGHAPRGACVTSYRYSTGLESLVGYLFLTGEYSRLQIIMEQVFKIIETSF